jgi:hypothetical protein
MSKISLNNNTIEVNAILNYIINKFNLSNEDMIEIIKSKQDDINIPISIFSDKIGVLESLSIYLHDEKKLSFKEIAKYLKRDYKTIWTSYNKGSKKRNKK